MGFLIAQIGLKHYITGAGIITPDLGLARWLIKSTHHSSEDPEFNSQHSNGNSQLSDAVVWYIDTHADKADIKYINNKS